MPEKPSFLRTLTAAVGIGLNDLAHVPYRPHRLLKGVAPPTIDRYHRLAELYRQSLLAHTDDLSRMVSGLIRAAYEEVGRTPVPALGDAFTDLLVQLLIKNDLLVTFPELDERLQDNEVYLLSLRRQLDEIEPVLLHEQDILSRYCEVMGLTICGICADLPALAFEAGDDAPRPIASVPLISLIDEPKRFVHAVLATFGDIDDDDRPDAPTFAKTRDRLARNAFAVSRLSPDQAKAAPHRVIWPRESTLSPGDLAEAYFSGTPFEAFARTPLPFALPDAVRFEHMHVVAGSGHGKTQALQHFIAGDLTAADDRVPSLVIIDSQGDMLAKIERLGLFDPQRGALADRLVIIDPTDVDHPPALGLFDFNLARLRGYEGRHREQIMNGVIELYDYIFGGLLGAELTQKQSVVFRYLARLMIAIPDATILTLKDVMQDAAPFAPYFDKLDGMAREFFRTEFNDRQFADTKKQILRRLWGVLENPTFERLFSNPRNKLDMFEALNSGKIVLVNTAKDFLKTERSSILGRFFIALTFQAALERAALPEHARRPAFLYIDEAADYFDDTVDSLLTQARKYRLGIVFAHQYLDQLPRALEASIMTNTSIKLAAGVSSADAHALAPNMGSSHDFIGRARKRQGETEFAAYVRNLTPSGITLTVPFGTLEAMPTMDAVALAQVRAMNRERYATRRALPRPVATGYDPPRPDTTTPVRDAATEIAGASSAQTGRDISAVSPAPEQPASTRPVDGDWRS